MRTRGIDLGSLHIRHEFGMKELRFYPHTQAESLSS